MNAREWLQQHIWGILVAIVLIGSNYVTNTVTLQKDIEFIKLDQEKHVKGELEKQKVFDTRLAAIETKMEAISAINTLSAQLTSLSTELSNTRSDIQNLQTQIIDLYKRGYNGKPVSN